MRIVFVLSIIVLIVACGGDSTNTQGNWIKGTEKEKLEHIERQFRGFDKAMVETGYRYQELYWAGEDENWDYAAYQLKKIKLAIETGLIRRPKRAKSAEHFLSTVIPQVDSSIQKKDKSIFDENFQMMTVNCNSCHAMEKVPFFNVQIPENRTGVIRTK